MRIHAKSFNKTNGSFVIVIQNEETKKSTPYTVDIHHPKYDDLKECFMQNDADRFIKYYYGKEEEVEQEKLKVYVSNTGITVLEDKILYKDVEIHNVYARRILEMRRDRMPIDAMIAFLENLMQNPSNRSQNELPDFLNNRNMPITEDGCFLAYKAVREDYYSKTAGKLTLISGSTSEEGRIYNGVGETIRCNRADVDDERGNECSYGLHVGGLQYSGPNGSFTDHGDKIVIVKVNPADVVSVPRDYNAQKVRVCAYEVISEFEEALPETCYNVQRVGRSKTPIDFDDIKELDEIMFQYTNKGTTETRYLIVEDIDDFQVEDDSVSGYVAKGDPSFDEASEEYRRFLRIKMSEIYKFNEPSKD